MGGGSSTKPEFGTNDGHPASFSSAVCLTLFGDSVFPSSCFVGGKWEDREACMIWGPDPHCSVVGEASGPVFRLDHKGVWFQTPSLVINSPSCSAWSQGKARAGEKETD